MKKDFSKEERIKSEELMHAVGVKQTEFEKALIAYFMAIKNETVKKGERGPIDKDIDTNIKRELKLLKTLIKGRKPVFTSGKKKEMNARYKAIKEELNAERQELEGYKKYEKKIELVKYMLKDEFNALFDVDTGIIDNNIEKIELLREGTKLTFKEAMEEWTSHPDFRTDNREWISTDMNLKQGGKKKKKKKKTRRKSNKNKKKKKKKKKTRTKK